MTTYRPPHRSTPVWEVATATENPAVRELRLARQIKLNAGLEQAFQVKWKVSKMRLEAIKQWP
jgi:hypothetical protein